MEKGFNLSKISAGVIQVQDLVNTLAPIVQSSRDRLLPYLNDLVAAIENYNFTMNDMLSGQGSNLPVGRVLDVMKSSEENLKRVQRAIENKLDEENDIMDKQLQEAGLSGEVPQIRWFGRMSDNGRATYGVFSPKDMLIYLNLLSMHILSLGEIKDVLSHELAHFKDFQYQKGTKDRLPKSFATPIEEEYSDYLNSAREVSAFIPMFLSAAISDPDRKFSPDGREFYEEIRTLTPVSRDILGKLSSKNKARLLSALYNELNKLGKIAPREGKFSLSKKSYGIMGVSDIVKWYFDLLKPYFEKTVPIIERINAYNKDASLFSHMIEKKHDYNTDEYEYKYKRSIELRDKEIKNLGKFIHESQPIINEHIFINNLKLPKEDETPFIDFIAAHPPSYRGSYDVSSNYLQINLASLSSPDKIDGMMLTLSHELTHYKDLRKRFLKKQFKLTDIASPDNNYENYVNSSPELPAWLVTIYSELKRSGEDILSMLTPYNVVDVFSRYSTTFKSVYKYYNFKNKKRVLLALYNALEKDKEKERANAVQ